MDPTLIDGTAGESERRKEGVRARDLVKDASRSGLGEMRQHRIQSWEGGAADTRLAQGIEYMGYRKRILCWITRHQMRCGSLALREAPG